MGYPQHLKSNGIKKPQQNTKKKRRRKNKFLFPTRQNKNVLLIENVYGPYIFHMPTQASMAIF